MPTEVMVENEILELIDAARKARYDKDADAIEALYAPGAALFSLAPPLLHEGLDVEATRDWLDSWDGPIVIDAKDFQVKVSGDDAFAYGFMKMTGKKRVEGPISFWMRETLCLHRENGRWLIVHEHTSVPFYMDGSARGAFDLQP